MSQPPSYNRTYDLTDYATDHPDSPYNAAQHDAELDNVELSLDGTLLNLALIQADDGGLRNGVVTPDTLSAAVTLLIDSGGDLTDFIKGAWVTVTAYVVGDIVKQSGNTYLCITAHTSGTFATDLAADKWALLSTPNQAASAITSSAYGHIAATTVQGAIQELVDEKALLAGNSLQTFSAAAASTAAHVVRGDQLVDNGLLHAVGAGTGDAITATLSLGDLSDGMQVCIRAPGTSSTTTPTFNLTLGATVTGAITIVNGAGGAALEAGAIVDGHAMLLRYRSSTNKWELLNPMSLRPRYPGTVNGFITCTVAANALTIALKTASGGDPSAADPVYAVFRNNTVGSGVPEVVTITGAMSLVIPNGATMGFTSGTPGRLWIGLQRSAAGTAQLWATNCQTGGYVFFYNGRDGRITTVAVTTGADSAFIFYATGAISNGGTLILGYADWSTALGTAGQWSANPDQVRPYGPGVPLPGTIIQSAISLDSAVATGTTVLPNDDTAPAIAEGDQYMTLAIDPTSRCNVMRYRHLGHYASGNTDTGITAAIFRGNTLVGVGRGNRPATANIMGQVEVATVEQVASVSTLAITVRAGTSSAGTTTFNGSAAARLYAGSLISSLLVEEIMG